MDQPSKTKFDAAPNIQLSKRSDDLGAAYCRVRELSEKANGRMTWALPIVGFES